MSGRKGELEESSLLWVCFFQVLITLSYETGQGGLLRRNHRVKLTASVSSEPHPAALVRMLAGELGCGRCHRRARA